MPKAKPKATARDQVNVQLTPPIRAELERLCDDEAGRTGQSRARIAGPLIRRLIREEYVRRLGDGRPG